MFLNIKSGKIVMIDETRKNDTELLDINKPVSYGSLTDDEFDSLMHQAEKSYVNGLCTDVADFRTKISKELGI